MIIYVLVYFIGWKNYAYNELYRPNVPSSFPRSFLDGEVSTNVFINVSMNDYHTVITSKCCLTSDTL